MDEEAKVNIYKSLLRDMYKVNTDIVVTGSFATILHLNTVHRTCNDIDMHFIDDYSIVELINQVNMLYDVQYKIIDFSISKENMSVKLSRESNEGCIIILDVYTNSLIDCQEIDGIKAIKLEKLIANKLINCADIKNSTNPRIKDLYDLQFLLRLNYNCDLIFYYLYERLKQCEFDKLFNDIINSNEDLCEDIFTQYQTNNYTTEDLKLQEIKKHLFDIYKHKIYIILGGDAYENSPKRCKLYQGNNQRINKTSWNKTR